MGFRTFVSMKVALIGKGEAVEIYAKRFANAGHDVLMAVKDGPKFELGESLSDFENIYVCSVEEAAELSDLIVIATPPTDVREVAYWLGDVRRKVIIDVTANIHVGAEEQVNTFLAIKAITGSPHVVKVFSTRGYERLLKPLFKDESILWVLAGDSKKAKEIAKILATDVGVDHFFDMGGSDALPLFNEMTRAWRKLYNIKDTTLVAINTVKI
jgi:predicted dinucleotide-binding enzyme